MGEPIKQLVAEAAAKLPAKVGGNIAMEKHFKHIGIEQPKKAIEFVRFLETQMADPFDEGHVPKPHKYDQSYDVLIKACMTQENPQQFYRTMNKYIDSSGIYGMGYLLKYFSEHPEAVENLKKFDTLLYPIQKFVSKTCEIRPVRDQTSVWDLQEFSQIDGKWREPLVITLTKDKQISREVIENIESVQRHMARIVHFSNNYDIQNPDRKIDLQNHPIISIYDVPRIIKETENPGILYIAGEIAADNTIKNFPRKMEQNLFSHSIDKAYKIDSYYPNVKHLAAKGFDIHRYYDFSIESIYMTGATSELLEQSNQRHRDILSMQNLDEKISIFFKHGLRPTLTNNKHVINDFDTFWFDLPVERIDNILTFLDLMGNKITENSIGFNRHNPTISEVELAWTISAKLSGFKDIRVAERFKPVKEAIEKWEGFYTQIPGIPSPIKPSDWRNICLSIGDMTIKDANEQATHLNTNFLILSQNTDTIYEGMNYLGYNFGFIEEHAKDILQLLPYKEQLKIKMPPFDRTANTWTLINHAKGLTDNSEMVTESLSSLDPHHPWAFRVVDNYIRLNPELKIKLGDLHKELLDHVWDADIPDRNLFWNNNKYILTKSHAAGYDFQNFQRFRSIVNNQTARDIIINFSISNLEKLKDSLGLTTENIYYTDRMSLDKILDIPNEYDITRFFRKILHSKPTSFKSSVQALTSDAIRPKLKEFLNDPLFEERFFHAIDEFGNISPSVIVHYVNEQNEDKRKEFIEKIRQIKHDIFLNKPLQQNTNNANEQLAETIAFSFPGTSYSSIQTDLSRLSDRCDDLINIKIRPKGYQGASSSQEKIATLREGQNFDTRTIGILQSIFTNSQSMEYMNSGGDVKHAADAFAYLIKQAGSAEQKEWFTSRSHDIAAIARITLGDKLAQFTESAVIDTSQPKETAKALGKAQELFGIYYKDNAPEVTAQYLNDNPEIFKSLQHLANEKRITQIEKNFGSISEEAKLELKNITEQALSEIHNNGISNVTLGHLLAFISEQRFFTGKNGLRKLVANENRKIIYQTKEGSAIDPNLILTGYVSKNAASYFAKTTAGVCTAGDIELFNRPDHFHMNLVKDNICVGNIQGYILEHYGQKALIFRGFNPSSSIVNRENVDILCDQMIDMVKQFSNDNGITQVFIPEQTDWHALTNRVGEGVYDYFKEKYIREDNETRFDFPITSAKTITRWYKIS